MINISRTMVVRQTGEMNKEDFGRAGYSSCSSVYTQRKILRATF